MRHGCTVVDNFPVKSISPLADFVVVSGESKSFSAKSVVVCAGPWTNRLLEPIG